MKFKFSSYLWPAVFIFVLILQACMVNASNPTAVLIPTDTLELPEPASTSTPVFSSTPALLFSPRPTQTPNLTTTYRAEVWEASRTGQTQMPNAARTPDFAATQKNAEWIREVQTYFEAGYLTSSEGKFIRLGDFSEEWAQLGWYSSWPLTITAEDFLMSGHLKWTSAYRSPDTSGCGFLFAGQKNGDHYAVFLDRSKILFVETEEHYSPIGTTRGSGRVDFGNPFDQPVEADLTLIVKGAYAYVLVNGKVVGEYTLAQSKNLRGIVGLALLSGTNRDFGTRCEITNLHLWIPNN